MLHGLGGPGLYEAIEKSAQPVKASGSSGGHHASFQSLAAFLAVPTSL